MNNKNIDQQPESEFFKLLEENKNSNNFTNKVRKLGFTVDGVYYTAIASLEQLSVVSHVLPIYRDGNRLGKRKTYEVLKRKQENVENIIKSVKDGTAEYLTDKDFEDLINKRKGKL